MKINLTNFMIAFLIFGFVILGIFSFSSNLLHPATDNDFGGSNSTIGKNFNNDLNPVINDSNDKLQKLGADSSIFDIVGFFINGVWKSISGAFASFGIMNELATTASKDLAENGNGAFLGLPDLVGLISAVLFVLIMGLLVYLFSGREI
jgi:hypothetical protein